MEHIDHLWPNGPCFFYDDALFKPGTDSFLLGAFPKTKAGERVCDLGCGTGLLGVLLLARQPGLTVTGVELSPQAAALAEKTAAANGFGDAMTVHQADLRRLDGLLPAGGFDLCVCNPPYFQPGRGATAADDALRTARCEAETTIQDVCAAASRLLRWGGRLALCFRPDRLTDLLCAARNAGLEPKRLRLVESRPGKAPSLLLLEARRGGNPGLTVEPSLVLADAAGGPTEEYNAIYFRNLEVPL